MNEPYSRHIKLESVTNFRDVGGYKARDGKTVAWRRVFRSGEFNRINDKDLQRLTREIKLNSVLDLRSSFEVQRQGTGKLAEAGITYHNIAFMQDGGDPESNERRFKGIRNLGEFYVFLTQEKSFNQRLIDALKIIAEPANHPLVFHCAIGKDRTGILAGVLLNLLGVAEADIIKDYTLSGPYMEEILQRITLSPPPVEPRPDIPAIFWSAAPESMVLFLKALQQEHGSIESYLKAHGAEKTLVKRLEKALLV